MLRPCLPEALHRLAIAMKDVLDDTSARLLECRRPLPLLSQYLGKLQVSAEGKCSPLAIIRCSWLQEQGSRTVIDLPPLQSVNLASSPFREVGKAYEASEVFWQSLLTLLQREELALHSGRMNMYAGQECQCVSTTRLTRDSPAIWSWTMYTPVSTE